MLLSARSRKTVGKVSDIAEIAKNNAESLGMDDEHNVKQSVEQNFHAMSKAWRKQVNFLNTQVVSNCEIMHLQNECRTLERCMLDLTQAYEVLESVIESPVEKIALYGKFEDMSRENNALVKHVQVQVPPLAKDKISKKKLQFLRQKFDWCKKRSN